jgi:hypothetical protein
MAAITGLGCVDERNKNVPCDSFGTSAALLCPRCGHPVLANTRKGQRGSSPTHPARCRKCGFECWVEVERYTLKMYGRSI